MHLVFHWVLLSSFRPLCDTHEHYNDCKMKKQQRRPLLFPEEFARFEYHMGQPIRMNNIRKRMMKDAKNANEAKTEAVMTSVLPDGRQVSAEEVVGGRGEIQLERFHELFIRMEEAELS